MGIHAIKNIHGINAKKIPWSMQLTITQPFCELETQDFTRKFVLTKPIKLVSMK